MKTIKIKLGANGELTCQGLENLNQYTFYDGLIDVYVPNSMIASTSICGLSFTNIDSIGEEHSQTRPLLFVKSNAYWNNENIEYSLYEIKVPKVLTMYSGKQAFNVYIETLSDDRTQVVSRTTSAIYEYNVNKSSESSDTEESSDISQLIARINGVIDEKQDKEDNNISVKLAEGGTTNNVVTALNSLGGRTYSLEETSKDHEERITTNENGIESNDQDIENLQGRTSTLENTTANQGADIANIYYKLSKIESGFAAYFHFLGSFTYEHEGEPTTKELDDFASTKESEKHIGDSVFAISTYGDTDALYICVWTDTWTIAQVEGIQRADNENFGIIKGNDRVSIVGGSVQDINLMYEGKTISIDAFYNDYILAVNTLSNKITSEAERAQKVEETLHEKDEGLQINIDSVEATLRNEYKAGDNALQTQISGKASLTDLYDYALPRSFNDVYYIDYKNSTISGTLSESSLLNSYATGQTDVGLFTLYNTDYYYQLSRKNSLMVKLYYYNYATNSGTLKITLNVYHNTKKDDTTITTQLCSYTKEFEVANDNDVHSIELSTTMSSLENEIVEVCAGDNFTFELFITNNTSETFLLALTNNKLYTSVVQYTCAQNPVVEKAYFDVIDEVLVFEKQGSVEVEILYL